ncbi:PAS domain-containing protein [Kordiimonas aestuarii]|uniref:PAS domain-containing protein n=1 Tax=Kordiimonas aestuarii TaxID=1005925 RepID=UPI0021D1DB38|nr:PAS domain-containing protein [Kordiimonas aestuarii]
MPISGVLEQLLNYWHELPRNHGANIPARHALNLAELHELLPRISLLKRVDRFDVQVSMIGTSAPALWHNPVTGFNAFDLTSPDLYENTAKLYDAVLEQPSGAHMLEKVYRHKGRDADIASLYLPLADRDGAPIYIIGCSVYRKRPAYGRINDRLIPDHQKVSSIEFIDLGYGKPTVSFEKPARRPRPEPELRWWDRFMPSKPRPTKGTWMDA